MIKSDVKNKIFFATQRQNGFVILLASLLAGLFLLIGASIFNISMKELVLSSGNKDSQYAFYAADSGVECAIYWDLKDIGIFATSTFSGPEPVNVPCNDQNIVTNEGWVWKTANTNTIRGQTVFGFDLFPGDPNRDDCVTVTVTKTDDAGSIFTVIESRGYNTCDVNNDRRVERGLRVTY